MQECRKCKTRVEDLTEDKMVMIVDPQVPRALWPVGLITKLIWSRDQHAWAAEVMVKGKPYLRSVARLIQQPSCDTNPTLIQTS